MHHIARVWASTVYAFKGRTIDTVIAAMEAKHLHFLPQKSFYVEISRAHDEKRLLRLQAQLARVNLLIVDELGYEPDLPPRLVPLVSLDDARYLASVDRPVARQ